LGGDGDGPLALPGTYTVEIDKRVDGVLTQLIEPTEFVVEPLGQSALPPADRAATLAFQRETAELQRAAWGAYEATEEAADRIDYIKKTIEQMPMLSPDLRQEARTLELRLLDLREKLTGDPTKSRRHEPALGGILDRVNQIVYGHWASTSAPTQTARKNYDIAAAEFGEILDDLRQLVETDLVALEQQLEDAGAPWTPGRGVPQWKR
jgi:hypothetical protein